MAFHSSDWIAYQLLTGTTSTGHGIPDYPSLLFRICPGYALFVVQTCTIKSLLYKTLFAARRGNLSNIALKQNVTGISNAAVRPLLADILDRRYTSMYGSIYVISETAVQLGFAMGKSLLISYKDVY